MQILYHQLQQHPELPPTIEGLSKTENRERRVDWAGKLIRRESEICFNFGKHKGEPVKDHRDYASWMLENDFPAETKRKLQEALQ